MQRQNERLQGAQETLLAERRQMEGKLNTCSKFELMRCTARISSLQKDNETFQGTNTKPQSNLVRFSANA